MWILVQDQICSTGDGSGLFGGHARKDIWSAKNAREGGWVVHYLVATNGCRPQKRDQIPQQ
jgi:hypothetical protein